LGRPIFFGLVCFAMFLELLHNYSLNGYFWRDNGRYMQNRQASANAECTAKPPKVVPIAEETSKLIAQDEKNAAHYSGQRTALSSKLPARQTPAQPN
jgi:hypothetical protein